MAWYARITFIFNLSFLAVMAIQLAGIRLHGFDSPDRLFNHELTLVLLSMFYLSYFVNLLFSVLLTVARIRKREVRVSRFILYFNLAVMPLQWVYFFL